jgi:hypothetical protein
VNLTKVKKSQMQSRTYCISRNLSYCQNREIGRSLANRVHAFRDRDIKRVIKSVSIGTGRPVTRVTVNPTTGDITADVDSSTTAGNTWDEVLNDAQDPKRPA